MQEAKTRESIGFHNGDRPDGYVWRTEESEMLNALIGAAWRHEMDQRTGVKSKMSNLARKVGVGRRRATW